MKHDERERLKALLDTRHSWPGDYLFKFILAATDTAPLDAFLKKHPRAKIDRHPSTTGKYISYSVTIHVQGSDEVLDIYAETNRIPGLISL
jgi:uncharacterized protein